MMKMIRYEFKRLKIFNFKTFKNLKYLNFYNYIFYYFTYNKYLKYVFIIGSPFFMFFHILFDSFSNQLHFYPEKMNI